MVNERRKVRGSVVVEDKRTERFVRKLLKGLGFAPKKFRFLVAPNAKGDAKVWVRKQYPSQVKLLRSKNYQADLVLLTVRDGDEMGCQATKHDLDKALAEAEMAPRQEAEHIATPAPTWNIETWLLFLLGHPDIDESEDLKHVFEHSYPGRKEEEALRDAAGAWSEAVVSPGALPSLLDGAVEMKRLG